MISVSRLLKYGSNPESNLQVSISGLTKEGEDYYVVIKFFGNDSTHSKKVYGIDPIQSIQLAFLEIRNYLKTLPFPVTWEGGEDGDNGFMIVVPSLFGEDYSDHVEELIQRETESYSNRIILKQIKNQKK